MTTRTVKTKKKSGSSLPRRGTSGRVAGKTGKGPAEASGGEHQQRSGRGSFSEPAIAPATAPKRPAARRSRPAGGAGSPAASAGRRRTAKRGRPRSSDTGLRSDWSFLSCEENFRSLVEISPDAVFIHQGGKYVFINPAGLRLFGAQDASEMIGRAVLDDVHPDYREFVRDRIELSYHLRRVTALQESRILRRDGTAVPVEALSAPVRFSGKAATLVMLRDVSWRRQHEETLRESERQLRTIFNSPNVLVGILEEHDHDILIVTANPELSALYHVKPGALNGRLASQFGVPPAVIQEQLRHYHAARQRGTTETWEYHRTWDGQTQWYHASVSYIGMGPQGRHRYSFVALDITERKQAEESLRHSEAEFRGMFELSGVGMAEADPATGRFLKVNRKFCDITGYPEAELLAKTFKDITHPEDSAVDTEKWARAVRGEVDAWFSEKRYVRRNGDIIWVAVNGTCLRDALDHPYRTIAVIQDITERKMAEETLRESEKRLHQMHEMLDAVTKGTGVTIAAQDVNFRYTYFNTAYADEVKRLTGKDVEIGSSMLGLFEHMPEQQQVAKEGWSRPLRGETVQRVLEFGDPGQHRRTYRVLHAPIRDASGRVIGAGEVAQDVTDSSRAEDILKARLRLIEFSGTHTLEELLVATLDEAEALTGSKIGFLHYLEEDQHTLSLQAWSTRTTRDMCRAEGSGRHYDVSQAGVWVDCIHQRCPVIHNDYPSLPHRKGMPTDHAPVTRELVVPVIRGDRIMAILGIGNKDSDYTDADVGVVSRLADLAWDITERKRAEDQLQRSHAELEQRVQDRTRELQASFARIGLVLESITDGFFAVDGDFRLTYVNSMLARLWGKDRKDLVGRTLWDVSPQARGTVFEEQYRKALADKAPALFEALSPFSDRWVEVSAFPAAEGLYVFVHDISERRKAEEERMRLVSAISSAAEMVVITDHRGMIQYVNPAFERITGYSRDEARGATMHLLDSGKQDEAFYRDVRGKLLRDQVWEGRFVSRKKDGTLFFEDCTISPVFGMSGDIMNYVYVRRDVTERLRLESIAESVDAMNNIAYIFSGVRHEIGNPINTVKMILTVLQQKLGTATKEAVADYVTRAQGEIERVEGLLRNLRNFNLYETQEPQRVMTGPFLDAFQRLIAEDLTTKGIALAHRVRRGAEELVADPRALQQVLLNIVTNATDAVAGRQDARIDIEVAAARRGTRLRITDNGRGMNDEERKNLFRPFYTTKPGGTGLGLVIVRKMLAQMGGTIEITSRRDAGTTVEIWLAGGSAPNRG